MLPALKEIRMTLVDWLLVILSIDSSRANLFIDPSSATNISQRRHTAGSQR